MSGGDDMIAGCKAARVAITAVGREKAARLPS